MNSANIGYIWANLKRALGEVQAELEDLKDAPEFPDLCQGLLRANHGMNFLSFVQILSNVATNRKAGISYLPEYIFGPGHIQFDLSVLRSLCRSMKSDPSVTLLLQHETSGPSCAFREAFDNLVSNVIQT